MEDGRWKIAVFEQRTANGEWRMANSEWRTANSEQRTEKSFERFKIILNFADAQKEKSIKCHKRNIFL
jgi:hypothetical protein